MGSLILASLDDPVVARCAWTEHFKDDDGVVNDRRGPIDGGAQYHAVRIADVALRNLKFEVAPVEATSLAPETPAKGGREISLDGRVAIRPAGYGDGADSVEFVTQGLPFLPFEEFGERHGSAQGEVPGKPLLSDRLGGGRLVAVLIRLEDEALVELGERQ